jgi:hypothetical protein
MKKQFLLSILLVAFVSFSNAAILTVSNTTNTPGSPGQYTTLAAAYAAAYNGDTLLIQGSPTSYGTITITKKITLFGAGYNPQRENPYPSTVDQVQFGNGSSGSVIMGLMIPGWVYFYYTSISTSNYTISRNNITAGIAAYGISANVSNVNIYNNFIGSVNGQNDVNTTNWVISNNIILGNCGSFNQPTIFFKNNLFINAGSQCLNTLSNITISNNIFYQATPSQAADMSMNSFNNNLTYNLTSPSLPYGTNVGSGNKSNMDPMFINVPNYITNYTYNYRLNAASPAKNAGTDGTDIGITGGLYPIYQTATAILTGEPPLPKVTQMSLINSSVPAGGNLQFNVKAKKVN